MEKINNTLHSPSSRYLGAEGEAYFRQQDASSILVSKYNEFMFKPYVGKDDDVLDFGCGGGRLLSRLNPRTKVGVEINPAARSQAEQSGISVFGSLDELEKSQTFSRIITSHALEHVGNPLESLIQMKHHLRPDGLLLWLSPIDDWRAPHQRNWNPKDVDMHLYTWTPLLIGNLLKVGGYKPESVSILVHACPPSSERLWNLSPALFHFVARLWAIARKQRQIFVVASPD